MIRFLLLGFVLATMPGIVIADQVKPADAFNAGASYYSTFTQPVIDNTTATNHLPSGYYGTTPSATNGLDAAGLYANGLGDLMTPGVQRNTDCMAMMGNPDAKEQLPCDAVKTMNLSDKSGFVFSKNDPLLKRSKDALGDPMTIINNAGMELNVKEIACTAGTGSVSTESVVKMCTELAGSSTSTCQAYQDVVIDHHSRFKCEQSVNPLEVLKCNQDTTVTFTYSCDSGTLNSATKQCEFTGTSSVVANCSSWGGAYYSCPVADAKRIDSAVLVAQISGSACVYGSSWGILASATGLWANYGCRANFQVTGLFCTSDFNYDATAGKCVKPATATPSALVVNGCAALEAKAL